MGPNYAVSAACATSNISILSAANHIIRGEAVSEFAFVLYLVFHYSILFVRNSN